MALLLQKCLPIDAGTPQVPSNGALLGYVIEARRRTAELLQPRTVGRTIDTMVEVARSLGAPSLYGASDIGHSIAGAMVYTAQDFRLWQPGETSAVLLVDGVLAGLAGIDAAIERAEAVGAQDIAALALDVLVADREVRSVRVETPRWPHLVAA